MKHPTATLEGANLDYAVAMARGYEIADEEARKNKKVVWVRDPIGGYEDFVPWCPSISWLQGGPIIEREHICIKHSVASGRVPACWFGSIKPEPEKYPHHVIARHGPTPLIAAMRCFVASKLGEEVEIP